MLKNSKPQILLGRIVLGALLSLGIFFSFAILTSSKTANSYYIGGAYATLVKCKYGQWGYKYGYIGTYRMQMNGRLYRIFFGSSYCEH